MSTDYGLHCKPCDSHSGAGTNYAFKQLSSLAHLSPDIKALYEKDMTGALKIETEFYWNNSGGQYFLIDWLVKHAGHELELYNEYGDYMPLEEQAP